MLKDEPEDLTHLAPTPGDVCVPLEDTPFLTDMLDEFILGSDNYCPLLSPDGTLAPELRSTDFTDSLKDAELGDTTRSKDLGESLADSDPFMYGDSPSSPCSIDPSAVSPPLTKYRQVSRFTRFLQTLADITQIFSDLLKYTINIPKYFQAFPSIPIQRFQVFPSVAKYFQVFLNIVIVVKNCLIPSCIIFQSPERSIDSLGSPTGGSGADGLSEDEMLMLGLNDSIGDDELEFRAPYIPMSDQDEALDLLISNDMVMWSPPQTTDHKSCLKWYEMMGRKL